MFNCLLLNIISQSCIIERYTSIKCTCNYILFYFSLYMKTCWLNFRLPVSSSVSYWVHPTQMLISIIWNHWIQKCTGTPWVWKLYNNKFVDVLWCEIFIMNSPGFASNIVHARIGNLAEVHQTVNFCLHLYKPMNSFLIACVSYFHPKLTTINQFAF